MINAAAGLNAPAGIRIVTPGVSPPEGGMSGTPVMEGGVHDDGGHYMTPWPLSEKYFLAAYSYLKTWPQGFPEYYRGLDEKGYALYLIDVFGNKELIYRDPNISCLQPIPVRARPTPPVLPHVTLAGRTTPNGPRPPAAPAAAPADPPRTAPVTVIDLYDGLALLPEGTVIKSLRIVQLLPKTTPHADSPRIGYRSRRMSASACSRSSRAVGMSEQRRRPEGPTRPRRAQQTKRA